MPIRCLLLILISLWLPAATAQSAFTLQGELREAGVPADGSYDFRLTLFAATAPVPEKGLVPIGVPRLVTDVPVIDGIFTVVVEPGAGFRGQDLQLGIEVRRSGEAEFEALTPYQTVHAVPYALFATDTSEDSVRGSSIVDRSIATVDLGEYAVTRFNITPGAIGTEQLDTASVTTMKLADGAVTRDKLAAGAIGPEHIDASQVQLRVAAQCPAGLPLVGIQIDGDPICDQQRRSLEGGTRSDDVAGFALDLSLRGDDRPILVYSLDDTPPAAGSSEPDFVILDCLDPVCQSATRREIVDTAALTAPDGIRVAMTLGAPLIALSSGGSLFTYRCTTSGCPSGTLSAALVASGVGARLDLAVRDGSGTPPMISYYDTANGNLMVFDCDTEDCSSGTARTLDSGDDVGDYSSIAIRANGRPFVSYYDATNDDLKYFDCFNLNCTGGSARTVSSFGNTGQWTSIAATDTDLARIAFRDVDAGGLRLLLCGNAECSFQLAGGGLLDAVDNPGTHASLALRSDGSPIIAYRAAATSDLRIYECAGASCLSGTARTVESVAAPGLQASLALRGDERPVVAHREDVGDVVRLLVCGDRACTVR